MIIIGLQRFDTAESRNNPGRAYRSAPFRNWFVGRGVIAMSGWLYYLRQLNMPSLLLRMSLAMFCGGMIGIERGRKHRAAGFRTYMLVCLGAALTMILSQYLDWMGTHAWAEQAAEIGFRTDIARLGAQVINGIGFLGAGVIVVTGHQEVKGLTTAAGLWASACMGLAIGAGFYECVLAAFLLIFLCIRILPRVENAVVERARNLNIYVEFQSLDDVGDIIACIKEQGVHIYEVDIDRGKAYKSKNPNAIFYIRLNHGQHHAQVMTAISGLESITAIAEL